MNSFKSFFLNSEGDNWFRRNISKINDEKYYDDFYSKEVLNLIKKLRGDIKLLDVGTSDGSRLKFISNRIRRKKIKLYGLDPSKVAVKSNKDKKIKIKVGTADKIPFKKNYFDIVLFSFCLYLCDTKLLNKIVSETLRVLKKNSFIIIFDFYSKKKLYFNYKHISNSRIRIMNNSKIFISNSNVKLIKEKKISYKLFYKIRRQKIENKMLAIHTLKKG